MDATRADVEFTAEVCQIAIDEGATTINIPDTVGYTMPHEFTAYLERLYALAPGLKDVVLSVHCHDDLGLAVANSFAGLLAGARQVECAVNGIGERAGNASLEEIVMLLHTRRPDVGLHTEVVTTDTVPAPADWPELEVRSVAALFAEAVARICSPIGSSAALARARSSAWAMVSRRRLRNWFKVVFIIILEFSVRGLFTLGFIGSSSRPAHGRVREKSTQEWR